MSEAAELEKLAQLRDSGVLTSKEFERKKREILTANAPTRSMSMLGFLTRAVGVIFVLVFLGHALGLTGGRDATQRPATTTATTAGTASPKSLPLCDASSVKSALQSALSRDPMLNAVNARLRDWSEVIQTGEQASPRLERSCRANLHVAIGMEMNEYVMRWRIYFPSVESRDWLITVIRNQ